MTRPSLEPIIRLRDELQAVIDCCRCARPARRCQRRPARRETVQRAMASAIDLDAVDLATAGEPADDRGGRRASAANPSQASHGGMKDGGRTDSTDRSA